MGRRSKKKPDEAHSGDPRWSDEGLAVVVIAGAGARGAYEAGVLAELMPALFPAGLRDVILLGTSAGAVNAALWAQGATPGRSMAEIGDEVCAFWESLDVSHVYQPLFASALKVLNLSGWFGRLAGVLDTKPLAAYASQHFKDGAIERNWQSESLRGVGVVATTCPLDGTGGRTCVFYEGLALGQPHADPDSAIDYVPTTLSRDHVLASAAIPVAFPAVRVATPVSDQGYYCDGGVRLNAPIEPAIKFNAKRLVVVSSHATSYPPKISLPDELPDVVDLTAQSLHAVLADGMIEDLRHLRRINKLVAQAEAQGATLRNTQADPPRDYVRLPLLDVAPQPGELAELARKVAQGKSWWNQDHKFRRFEYALFRWLVSGIGSGLGNDELLSYLFFDRAFATAQVALGRQHGRAALERAGI